MKHLYSLFLTLFFFASNWATCLPPVVGLIAGSITELSYITNSALIRFLGFPYAFVKKDTYLIESTVKIEYNNRQLG